MDKQEISRRWYDKGKPETDEFDKFIYLWISFNALYSEVIAKGEKEQIKGFVNRYYNPVFDSLISSENNNFFKTTEIKDCKLGNKGSTKRYIETLKGNSNSKNKIIALILCVYQARCNLFHGDKIPQDYNDKQIAMNAGNVLEQFLDIYFSL